MNAQQADDCFIGLEADAKRVLIDLDYPCEINMAGGLGAASGHFTRDFVLYRADTDERIRAAVTIAHGKYLGFVMVGIMIKGEADPFIAQMSGRILVSLMYK